MNRGILTVIGLFGITSSAWGQPAFGITISLADRSSLEATTPGYNSATQNLLVTGFMVLPPAQNPSDYRILVQNQNASFSATTPGSTTNFQYGAPIPMGRNTPLGGWSGYAYSSDLADADHIAKPIIAELLHLPTGEVRARARIVIFDKRFDGLLQPRSSATRISDSLGTELTGRGLDKLEALHKSVMPQPSRAEFDARLTANFRGSNQTVTMNTDLKNNSGPTPKACVPLSDASAQFRETLAWTQALAEASGQYATYRAAKYVLENGAVPSEIASLLPGGVIAVLAVDGSAQAIVDASCVREIPSVGKFEVCAGSLRGDSDTLAMTGVASVNLSLGQTQISPPRFSSLSVLGRLGGTVNAEARNFFFRYSEAPNRVCAIRPKKDIPETQITSDTTLSNWRKCSQLGMAAAAPFATTAIDYEIQGDSGPNSNQEKNQLSARSAPVPLFDLGANRAKDTQHGLCALNGFQHNADALLERFWTRMRTATETSWNQGSPKTQEANALDLAFSRWETGIYGDANLVGTATGADHRLTHAYAPTRSYNLADRFLTRMDTEAKVLNATSPTEWLFADKGPIPCAQDGLCGTNQNRFGRLFDASFTVTTGALNQVIKELAASPILAFNWAPTYDELGLAPPTGILGTAAAVLDGPTLAQVNPAFAQLGNKVATLRVRPSIMPYTYMDPDPPNNPAVVHEGRQKLTYQLASLEFDFIVSDPGLYGDGIWLRSLVDFYDPELGIAPAANTNFNRLTPAYSGNKRSAITVMRTSFASCPMGTAFPWPSQPPPFPVQTCAAAMATSLFTHLRPVVEDRLLYILSRFPAPQLFDAGGQGATPLSLHVTDQYQQAQVITFYGNLQ